MLPQSGGGGAFSAVATSVVPLSGNKTALTVTAPDQGGTIGFTQLNAPTADLVLNLGGGNASGQINVGNLAVNGSGGSVSFINSTVAGQTGTAAAAVSRAPAGEPGVCGQRL